MRSEKYAMYNATPLPRPGSRPSPQHHPRSQHFGLPASALGAEATEGPKLLLNQGPSDPCYTTANRGFVPGPHWGLLFSRP